MSLLLEPFLEMLRCPRSGGALSLEGDELVSEGGDRYRLTPSGVPLFAEQFLSDEARSQKVHHDRVADVYLRNQDPAHIRDYLAFADRLLLDQVRRPVKTLVELCCGRGDALVMPGMHYERGVGVDISTEMLEAGRRGLSDDRVLFAQGDVTRLPLRDACCDTVVCLGGVHHVPDRVALFSEVRRILQPGGRFLWREPLDDFLPWRALRAVIYRVSPTLDFDTEQPLRRASTERALAEAGLRLESWRTCGFAAWGLLMNAEVLVVNRFLRYLPGIRALARAGRHLDEGVLSLPGMSGKGMQVVGVASPVG